ncbi:hypothetical protein AALO_G00081350 [Alosa alosa]|uniref:Uncharacterized protein n=1 Tax=Alosa alosa TaxID=278164 RepID=A0AAV6GXY7_9TELE|nr:serine/arginine repetitive matrix protein 2 [Alosa alosa]KAG5279765.1 hypothetical protein AALO_G00081350 [Alosa alosa]
MKPDGVVTATMEPMELLDADPVIETVPPVGEGADQVSPPSMESQETGQGEPQPAETPAPAAKTDKIDKPADPKAKTKGPAKPKTTGTAGTKPASRPGTAQSRLQNGTQKPQTNGVTKKPTMGTADKKTTSTTGPAKKPAGTTGALASRSPTKPAERKSTGATRPTSAPNAVNGAKTGTAQPLRKTPSATSSEAKTKPKTTAPASRPTSAAPKPSTAASTKSDRPPVSKTTRPVSGPPSSRPSSAAPKTATSKTTTPTKPATPRTGTTASKPATPKTGSTTPSAGRTPTPASKTTTPVKKDVSKPSTPAAKKPAASPLTRPSPAKTTKPDTPKSTPAAKPDSTKKPAASSRTADAKTPSKPKEAKSTPSKEATTTSKTPGARPGTAKSASPKKAVGSNTPTPVKRGPKPTVAAQPEPKEEEKQDATPAVAAVAAVAAAGAAAALASVTVSEPEVAVEPVPAPVPALVPAPVEEPVAKSPEPEVPQLAAQLDLVHLEDTVTSPSPLGTTVMSPPTSPVGPPTMPMECQGSAAPMLDMHDQDEPWAHNQAMPASYDAMPEDFVEEEVKVQDDFHVSMPEAKTETTLTLEAKPDLFAPDHFSGASPADHLSSTSPADHLSGAFPADHLSSTSPADHLSGAFTADHLSGAFPADHLSGAFPADHLSGASPVDHLSGAFPADHLSGAFPADHLSGAFPADHLSGAFPSSPFQEREEAVEKADEEINEDVDDYEEENEDQETKEFIKLPETMAVTSAAPHMDELLSGAADFGSSDWQGHGFGDMSSQQASAMIEGMTNLLEDNQMSTSDMDEFGLKVEKKEEPFMTSPSVKTFYADEEEKIVDMDVGSEHAEKQHKVGGEEEEEEEEEDDEDVEMVSEGMTESGLESCGNVEADDFTEDVRGENLNCTAPQPPIPPSTAWGQTNPFGDPWAQPPSSLFTSSTSPDPVAAQPETPTKSPAQAWLEFSSPAQAPHSDEPMLRMPEEPSAPALEEMEGSMPEDLAPPAAPAVGMSQSSTLSGTALAAHSSSETSTPEELRDYDSSSGVESRSDKQQTPVPMVQPDLEQDLGIHLERGDGEEEEAETLPADEVLGGPPTAPASAPSSASTSGDEASDTEGEMQINDPDAPAEDDHMVAFDSPPPTRNLPMLAEDEEATEAQIGDGAEEDGGTPQSANSVASYGFDCTSNSNAHSTAESCGKSPGIFSLENEDQMTEEAKDPSLIKELTLPSSAAAQAEDLLGGPVDLLPLGQPGESHVDLNEHQYMLCGKTGADLHPEADPLEADARHSSSPLPGDGSDGQPPYYSTICDKTDNFLAGNV